MKTVNDTETQIVITETITNGVSVVDARVIYKVESDGLSETRAWEPTLNAGKLVAIKNIVKDLKKDIKTHEGV